ncbi:MAG: hypothetical protein U0838_05585 [Chloroflexota bacterium]
MFRRHLIGVAVLCLAGCAAAVPSTTPGAAPSAGATRQPASVSPAPVATAPAASPVATIAPNSSAAAPSPSGPPSIDDAGAKRISITPAADWLMIAEGSVWTAAGPGIVQLDPKTGDQRAFTKLLGICLGFDAGYGALWAGGCDDPAIWRIEPASGKVLATIPLSVPGLQDEGSVAAGEGGVWAISTDHQLIKVDPVSNKVAGTWPLPVGAAAVRAGLGSLWVTVSDANQLLRIDPKRPSKQTEIAVGAYPRFLTIGAKAVWVMNQQDGSITRVSADGRVLGTTQIADRIDGGDIAFGGGSVWVQPGGELLVQIDPASGKVLAHYGPKSGSGSVAADDAAVWVSAHDVNAIWRLPLH